MPEQDSAIVGTLTASPVNSVTIPSQYSREETRQPAYLLIRCLSQILTLCSFCTTGICLWSSYPLMSTISYIFKTGGPTHISPSSPLIKSCWVNCNLFWEKNFRNIHFVLIPSLASSCSFGSSALDHFAWSFISSSRFFTSHWIWMPNFNSWLVLWPFLWLYLTLIIWFTLFRLFWVKTRSPL